METKDITLATITRFIWSYSKIYKLALFLTVAGSLAASVFDIIAPLFYKQFVDSLEGMQGVAIERRELFIFLTPLFTAFVFKILEWIVSRISSFSNGYMQSKLMARITTDAFTNLHGHSYKFFIDSFSGGLSRKVNRLAHAYGTIIDQCVYVFLPIIISTIGILIIVFNRSTTIGLIFLIGFSVFIYANYKVVAWKQKYDEKRSEADTHVSGIISDSIINAITVKLFSGKQHEKSLVDTASEKLMRVKNFVWNINEVIRGIQGFLSMAIEIVVMIGTFNLYRQGVLTLGDFFLFQSYIMTLASHIWGLSWVMKAVYEATADAKEMISILETPYEVADKLNAESLIVTKGAITFDHVDFYFNETRKIFEDFTLSIKPGERIAFVGPSGAGKSTVIKLLFRFYDIARGKILIDGKDISGVTQESLRNAIALVPQEPILFHRTLLENIRYGRRAATDEEVIEAAKKAHCHEFISEMPEDYATMVGERGVKLSGGERQRVAIARAILKNAPILVLDEATSSLDSQSESYIQEALETLMKGKTSLVIAHRLSTIMKMDRIVVIEKGHVRAHGTHQELLAKDELYRKLWNLQAGGFIE